MRAITIAIVVAASFHLSSCDEASDWEIVEDSGVVEELLSKSLLPTSDANFDDANSTLFQGASDDIVSVTSVPTGSELLHPSWSPEFTPLATGTCCNSVVTYDDTNNYFGIGKTPVQHLDIGSHTITNKAGTRATIGATNNISGINMGTTDNERAWIIWDGDSGDEYLYLGTRSDSTSYSNTMIWRDGQVGIGTIHPDSQLHIQGNSTTEPTWSSDDMLIVENDDNAYLNILAPTYGKIVFSDSSRAQGHVAYQHSVDRMGFRTGGTTRMTLVNGKMNVGSSAGSMGELYVTGYLEVGGTMKINPASPAATSLCVGNTGYEFISLCSSSARYKQSVAPLARGLDTVDSLRPIRFNWKTNGKSDLGFIAEEVKQIDPMLVTYKDGKVEGVKYRRLNAVLVSAIQELQEQNADMRTHICNSNPKNPICQG